jgi:hypothetical protein
MLSNKHIKELEEKITNQHNRISEHGWIYVMLMVMAR